MEDKEKEYDIAIKALSKARDENEKLRMANEGLVEEEKRACSFLKKENARLKRLNEYDFPKKLERLQNEIEDVSAMRESELTELNRLKTIIEKRGDEKECDRAEDLQYDLEASEELCRELEKKVSEQESLIEELRTEFNEKIIDSQKDDERVKELECIVDVMNEAKERENKKKKDRNESQSKVESFKTEIDKLRRENERLRRQKSTIVRPSNKSEIKRANNHRDTASTTVQQQQPNQNKDKIKRMHNDLETKNDEIRHLTLQLKEVEKLRDKVSRQNELIQRLQSEKNNQVLLLEKNEAPIKKLHAEDGSIDSSRSRKQQQKRIQLENERLRKENEKLSQELRTKGSSPSNSSSRSRIKQQTQQDQLQLEIEGLRKENEKLTRELQVFDLDFFEEIEDLKYKYNEATSRLQRYEE